jgi:hypothetical protein
MATAINLGMLIHDPDFCTSFQVVKQLAPRWVEGEEQRESVLMTVEGIVAPASPKDLELLPEGDRRSGMKTFYTDECTLDVSDTEKTSDVCIFRGIRYKLIHSYDYGDNGYYKAIGTLLGDEEVEAP